MDGKLFARIGAIVFVAVAITATAIEMTRKEEEPAAAVSARVQETATDPLRAAVSPSSWQRRCAARDTECLRVWAATRDRFLGVAPAPRQPAEGL